MSKLIKVYHPEDKVNEQTYRWPFVYLHGKAEDLLREVEENKNLLPGPSDIAVFTAPMPTTEDMLIVEVYGKKAVAHIAYSNLGNHLQGRVVLTEDTENHNYLANSTFWR